MELSFLMMQLSYHTEEKFEREKLLKFWVHFLSFSFHVLLLHVCDKFNNGYVFASQIQSFLAGVPYIVIGFR